MTFTSTTRIPVSGISRRIGALGKAREFGILIALVLVIIAATAKNPAFLFSPDGWRDLWLTPSILVLVAIGQAIVIITRNSPLPDAPTPEAPAEAPPATRAADRARTSRSRSCPRTSATPTSTRRARAARPPSTSSAAPSPRSDRPRPRPTRR